MSHMAQVETLFARLRTAEWTARAQLVAGCADDAANIERFLSRPLDRARREALEFAGGFGSILDADLARSLWREAFERIASTCAQSVFANADLRIRARFREYTNLLGIAEAGIASDLVALHPIRTKHPLPRMFAIVHLEFDDGALPAPPENNSDIAVWTETLHVSVRRELVARIDVALDRVLTSGSQRMGIIKTRLDLAFWSLA